MMAWILGVALALAFEGGWKGEWHRCWVLAGMALDKASGTAPLSLPPTPARSCTHVTHVTSLSASRALRWPRDKAEIFSG